MKTCCYSSDAQSPSVQKKFWDTPVRLVLGLLMAMSQARPSSPIEITHRKDSARTDSRHLMRCKQMSFKRHGLVSMCSNKKKKKGRKKKGETFSLFPLGKFLSYHGKEWPRTDHLHTGFDERPQPIIPFAAI